MRYIAGGIGLGAALVASCLMGAGPAGAEPAATAKPKSLYAPSALVLTVGKGENPKTHTVQRAVTLRCEPSPGGDHPAAPEACADIAAARGGVAGVRDMDPDRVCTRIYDPVVITAQGVWEGRLVSYRETFANECVMLGEKGAVFEF